MLITITHFPRRAIKGLLAGVVRFMRAHPGIKRKLVRLFSFFPAIDRMVLRLSRRVINGPAESLAPAPVLTIVGEASKLSLGARQIYKDLLDAIEPNEKGK